jgi:hypothetical protein
MGIAGQGSGQVVEDDEVECLLANQIYKVRAMSPSRPSLGSAFASACLTCIW